MSPMVKSSQRPQKNENQLEQMVTLKMNNLESQVCKRQEVLIRDQNLKDNIMAVQRRIPRFLKYYDCTSFNKHI